MENPYTMWSATFNNSQRYYDLCGNTTAGDSLIVANQWAAHNKSSAKIRIRLAESDTPINSTNNNLNMLYFGIR